MAVTIRDLAAACGCNVSTVSRALRDDPRIGAATRARVLAAAQRLGYRANLAARSLITGRTGVIWLLAGGLASPTDYQPAEAAAARCRERGYDLLMAVHHGERAAHGRLLERMRQGVCDGALVLGSRIDVGCPLLRELHAGGFPLVFVDRHDPGLPAPAVSSANEAAAAGLVERCAGEGARTLVIASSEDNAVADARRRGYRRAARRLGLAVLTPEAAIGDVRPQAVIGNTQHSARRHGPRLVAIGVFDDWQGDPPDGVAVWVQPQDFAEMARQATDLVLARIAGETVLPGLRLVPCPAPVRVDGRR